MSNYLTLDLQVWRFRWWWWEDSPDPLPRNLHVWETRHFFVCTHFTKSGIPMTPTSSFSSCLLGIGITQVNHLHYSSFYSGILPLDIHYFCHPDLSRHPPPRYHTWPTHVIVTGWSHFFFSTRQLSVQTFCNFEYVIKASTSRLWQSMSGGLVHEDPTWSSRWWWKGMGVPMISQYDKFKLESG
jgi:hypothetical protein